MCCFFVFFFCIEWSKALTRKCHQNKSEKGALFWFGDLFIYQELSYKERNFIYRYVIDCSVSIAKTGTAVLRWFYQITVKLVIIALFFKAYINEYLQMHSTWSLISSLIFIRFRKYLIFYRVNNATAVLTDDHSCWLFPN